MDPLTYAITATLYWTGIRNSSLCNLDLDDILWDAHRLALRNAKRGKTYTVFIPDQALETIQAYLPYREKPILAKDHDAVFINPNTRQRIDKDAANYRVKKASIKAGIRKRVYAHLLRHTHGSLARTKGLALDTIARQMGHESIATTQLYAQLADEVYEQEYQSFFDGHPANCQVKKRRPDFHPDRDWAYR
jgi:integrase